MQMQIEDIMDSAVYISKLHKLHNDNYNYFVKNNDISKVPPHAFVWFAAPSAVKEADKAQ
jgi:hypothetical protein